MCDARHTDDVSRADEGQGRPLICITPRWFPGTGVFCADESVGDVFMDALIDAGGMPLMMPITRDAGLIRAYVEMCDGFAIPGGHSTDPCRFGGKVIDAALISKERDKLEFPLIEMVLETGKPLLAVCRGEQVLNVALGGSLVQDVTKVEPREGMQVWHHRDVLHRPAHPVEVEAGSLLARCVGGRSLIQTNSSHNECVSTLGAGVVACGHATDGVVEAIEVPSQRFCLGVQWHPEYTWRLLETDRAIWRAFVAAAAAGGCRAAEA